MPRQPRPTAVLPGALLAFSAWALASCATPPTPGTADAKPPAAAVPMPGLTDVDWRCVELFDADGTPIETTGNPPTLRIARGGRASGFAGVNRYGCDARIGNSVSASKMPLSFGPVMATRMAGPPERMALEQAYTAMLGAVRDAHVVGGGDGAATLVLRSERGACARFVAGSRPTSAAGRADTP